jgi:simple sugar transport system ATP-binding protein
MNILYGLYHPDEGEIYLKGKKTVVRRPRRTRSRAGSAMVHQHFMLDPGDDGGREHRPRAGADEGGAC